MKGNIMDSESRLLKAVETLMTLLDSEVGKSLAITRRDQLSTLGIEKSESFLRRPTLDERTDDLDLARQNLKEALYHWLAANDSSWRDDSN